MIENVTAARLRSGETVVGCFIRYPEPTLAEYVAMLGWDFLVFDGEHGPVQPGDVEGLSRAAQLRGATPLARVPSNDAGVILRFLDAGAFGVHVPQVSTAAGAHEAVQAVKYWPRGDRGLAGTRAADWGLTESLGDYTRRANAETLVVLHLETAAAVEAVDEIVAVDGVDVIFIGAVDLSQSLGHPGETGHPDVKAAIDRIVAGVVPSGKALGVYVPDAAAAADWRARGARYITIGLEALLRQGTEPFITAPRS